MITTELRELIARAIENGDESMIALMNTAKHKEEARSLDIKADKKILIIGDVKMKKEQIYGFLRSVNISKERLEFMDGYDTFKHKSIRSYQYNQNYALILVGAMPHSMKDMGSYSSLISAMEKEEGWPDIIRLGQKGLKATLSNVKQAIISSLASGVLIAA